MATAHTLTGKPFEYTGSLSVGLVVKFATTSLTITPEIVQVIRREILKRSPVQMGANRDPLVKDSIGESLKVEYGKSPQIMSYVLPLLVQEGFCDVTRVGRGFVIRKRE